MSIISLAELLMCERKIKGRINALVASPGWLEKSEYDKDRDPEMDQLVQDLFRVQDNIEAWGTQSNALYRII